MADDEFDDDGIDWASIDLPMPTVTPSKKKPRLGEVSNDDRSSLLQNLEIAPTFLGNEPSQEEGKGDDVGDVGQLKALELARDGKNLFLTGKAGTGKSWITKKIVKTMHDDDKIIYVTAPTGIAAVNVGGLTIHHWARFLLGEHYEDFNNMLSEHTMKMIRNTDTLLIDEISMLDGHLFDCLECMISIIRQYDAVSERVKQIKERAGSGNNVLSQTMLDMRWDSVSGLGDIPSFGGMQLIVVGDFFQLPPVPAGCDLSMENENLKEVVGYDLKIGRQGSYAFESRAWRHGGFQTVELTEIHRQSENDGLFEFLNAMRHGELDLLTTHEKTLSLLQSPLPKRTDGIIPTELHSKNYVVNQRNKDELCKLSGDLHEFVSIDEINLGDEYKAKILASNGLQHLSSVNISDLIESHSLPRHVEDQIKHDLNVFKQHARTQYFERGCRAAHNIELKEDAQVMLLWNLEFKAKLANGSRGILKGFFPATGYYYLIAEEVKKREEERHPSKNDDNDSSDEDSKKLAMSDRKGVGLPVITPHKMTQETQSDRLDFSDVNHELVQEVRDHIANMGPVVIERELREMRKVLLSNIVELPYVHFANGKRRVIRPQPFSKEYKGIGTATRWQIPLTLAWAISIHKSQGMTIECLHVDLSDCFAIGQAYVACSRGKCLNSMTVKHFKLREIKTSEKVKSFYDSVKRGDPYSGGIWSDTIATFDEEAKQDIEKKQEMKRHYNNVMPCKKCSTKCVIGQVMTNRNNNQGKFFLYCPAAGGDSGHSWELVNSVPLKKPDDEANNNNANQQFKFLTPGVGGAIPGRLEDQRFVATGVFPELGGGFGLKLGRDRLKGMIESFGGKVTGSISGKTNFVIVGEEPGVKRLEEAKSKGVPTIDRVTLHHILMGEAELLPT